MIDLIVYNKTYVWSSIIITLILLNCFILFRCGSKLSIITSSINFLFSILFFINGFMDEHMVFIEDDLQKVFSTFWYVTTLFSIYFIFFDKKNKARIKLESSPLTKFHIQQVNRFLQNKDTLYSKRVSLIEDNDISSFVELNQKSLSNFIKLKNKKYTILPSLYEESYKIFKEKFTDKIYSLSLEKEASLLPSRVAFGLRSEFDKNFDHQLNVSIFDFKEFYNFNKNLPGIDPNPNNESERIFIIKSKDVFDTSSKDVKSLKDPSNKASFYTWVREWHERHNEELSFVLEKEAQDLKENYQTTNFGVEIKSLDFSINYNNDKDEKDEKDEKLTLVNIKSEQIEIVGITENPIKHFEISISKSKSYYNFFKRLKGIKYNKC